MNREEWLSEAVGELTPLILPHADDRTMPPVAVSCGWPNKRPRKTIGQCFATKLGNGTAQVFISPILTDAVDVLGTLTHELVHAIDDCTNGHKAPFKRVAVAVGLEGKMTETKVGAKLRTTLEEISSRLGPYPHGGLRPVERGKVGSRLLKVECLECGYNVRTTAKWLAYGTPTCVCGMQMYESV